MYYGKERENTVEKNMPGEYTNKSFVTLSFAVDEVMAKGTLSSKKK